MQFNKVCLKDYAYLNHNTRYDQFPLNLIATDKNTLQRLPREERTDLTNFGITILDKEILSYLNLKELRF